MDILSFAIGKIAGGGSPTPPSLTNLTATENGTYNHSGFDGYDEVIVAVPAVEPDLVDLSVSANGTYTHSGHDGYDEVVVNVANSYGASDEGKVVSNGALTAQTAATKTQNGTYDTTLNNYITVNVESAAPDLEDITITQNGTYESSSHDGYGEVTVNVSGGSEPEIGCVITRDDENKVVTYDIYGYGKNSDMPEKKTPPFSLLNWIGDYIGNGLTWHVYVNLHSNEIETIPTSWMSGGSTNNWKIPHVSLPDSVKSFASNAFYGCAFTSIDLPSSLNTIGTESFKDCRYLTKVVVPASVNMIASNAFVRCSALQVVEFKGTPTGTVYSNIFNSDSELTDIYCPWSLGEVSGAPWGATNATIHYDYTGE